MLNPHVEAVLPELPRGLGYHWDPHAPGGGALAPVTHAGRTLLTADPRGSFCCGAVLEIYFRALAHAGAVCPLTWEAAKDLRARAFILDPRRHRSGIAGALVHHGLAHLVPPSQALPGDFAQLWRRNGSGHTVVVRSYSGGRLEYLSTQSSTGGVGVKAERPAELHVARAIVPEQS